MSYDDRKRSDAERQERKRLRDSIESIAATRAIDQALIGAMREVLTERYRGRAGNAWRDRDSELGRVIALAFCKLERSGYDVRNPVQVARVLHRLGDQTRDHDLIRPPL